MDPVDLAKILSPVISAISLLGGITAYFFAGVRQTTERQKNQAVHQAEIERDIKDLQTETATLSAEVHGLNERVTGGFQQIYHVMGRVEGKIDAFEKSNKQ
ncbi:MAG: hypothetical protein HC924_15945 [Synechococcaceae cyanobacterium SM2_3_2]|nr:hypothetical protein [Synechococcaceae cyanobacterium SM2_3_2]